MPPWMDIAHPEWFDLGSEVEAGARLRGVPSTRGSDVAAVAGEITEVGEEGRECFFVFLAQDLVESALIGGLLQQLGHVSVGVGFGCSVGDRLIRQRLVAGVVDEGVRVLVSEHLQFDAQFAAVVDGVVILRNTRRTEVVEVAFRERTGLCLAVQVGFFGAVADRPHPTTRAVACFEDGDLVSGLLQFVGGAQTGRSAAEDHDGVISLDLSDQVTRCRCLKPPRRRRHCRRQADGRHSTERQARAAGDSQAAHERSTCVWHSSSPVCSR